MPMHICPKCGYQHVGLRYRGPGIGRWFWRCLRDEQTGVWCSWGREADELDTVMADAVVHVPVHILADKEEAR